MTSDDLDGFGPDLRLSFPLSCEKHKTPEGLL